MMWFFFEIMYLLRKKLRVGVQRKTEEKKINHYPEIITQTKKERKKDMPSFLCSVIYEFRLNIQVKWNRK